MNLNYLKHFQLGFNLNIFPIALVICLNIKLQSHCRNWGLLLFLVCSRLALIILSFRRQADIRQIESWIDFEKETLYCGSQLLTSKTIRIRITKDTEV